MMVKWWQSSLFGDGKVMAKNSFFLWLVLFIVYPCGDFEALTQYCALGFLRTQKIEALLQTDGAGIFVWSKEMLERIDTVNFFKLEGSPSQATPHGRVSMRVGLCLGIVVKWQCVTVAWFRNAFGDLRRSRREINQDNWGSELFLKYI